MNPAFYNKDQDGNRVLDLADGRVLFLPRGRGGPAYVVPDYVAGWTAEQRLEWAERIAWIGFTCVLLAATFFEQWTLLLVIVPLLAAPRIVENIVVRHFVPATDSRAQSETEAADTGAPGWVALAVFLASVAWCYYLWTVGDRGSAKWRIDLVLVGLSAVFTGAQLFRQHRTAQERQITAVSRDPENKPLNPR